MNTPEESGRSQEAWLLETTRALNRVISGASDPKSLGQTLPAAMTEPVENKVAWIGRQSPDGETITVRASSIQRRLSSLDAVDDSVTAQVIESEDVEYTSTDEAVEYQQLRDSAAIPVAETAVGIPLPEPHVTGVLHLYTDGDPSQPQAEETFRELATRIEGAFKCQQYKRELGRERDRLEQLRSLVSHDLGNPINIAAGRLDLVRSECESEHIDHVESGIQQINALADEGLKFVKAGRKIAERSETELAELARDCWKSTDADDTNLSVERATVYAEPERLRMILNQLFENAVVHNDHEVTVTVGPLPNRRGFYVEDSGKGIPEDEQAYVFDRGYTTISRRSGNGLAIVEEVARALGWELRISEEGGARIEIETGHWGALSGG